MKTGIVAFAALLLGSTAATAAPTFIVTGGTDVKGDVVINFDDPTPAAFTISGTVTSGNADNVYREPFAGSGNYLTTMGSPGGSQVFNATTGYSNVSFYWGSIDSYNRFTLLDAAGEAIGDTMSAAVLGMNADSVNGARVTAFSDVAIHGIRFFSAQPAFEVDNIAFNATVPEPASWAMMVLGFGLIGAAARGARRRPAMA